MGIELANPYPSDPDPSKPYGCYTTKITQNGTESLILAFRPPSDTNAEYGMANMSVCSRAPPNKESDNSNASAYEGWYQYYNWAR